MTFHEYSSPYDWSRLRSLREIACNAPDGIADLSIGSPVDSVPETVQQALSTAANDSNAYGYPNTAGTPALQSAIYDWFARERHADIRTMNAAVVPTVGSKEAVALMPSLLGIGVDDIVVQPTISYPTYEIGTQLAGATVLKVDDVANVQSWCHNPQVKAIWVNSPNNPAGTVLSVQQLRDIVVAARDNGITVLSDECYALLHWSEERPAPSILTPEVCDNDAHNLLCLYSLSKQSNMAGYRTAFIAGDAELVEKMTAYRRQIGQIIPGPVQQAMTVALQDEQSVQQQRERYRKRLELLSQAFTVAGYHAPMPEGGLYCWIRCIHGDCWADLQYLASLGILASPGEFYGDSAYIRVAATASDDTIAKAVQRLIHQSF